MRRVALIGFFALTASTAFAQTDTAPGQAPSAPPTTAQAAPGQAAPADTAAAQQPAAAGPANLCQELVAFMKAPPPDQAAATTPAKPATPPAADRPAAAGQTAAAGQASGEDKPAEQKPTQPMGETAASGNQDKPTPQQASDQAGPAHSAPDQGSKVSEATGAEGAEKKSSLSAPVPKDQSSTPKTSVMSVSEAESLAQANDIAACKDAARELRLAGVAMPPPLLALTALDLKYQQAGAQ